MPKVNSLEPLDNLSRLNESERKILHGFCLGLDHSQIAQKYHFKPQSVRDIMGSVYKKLFLDTYRPAMRRRILFVDICPKMLSSDSEITVVLAEEGFLDVSERVKRMVDEDEKALISRQPEELELEPVYRPVTKPRNQWGLVLVGVILGGALIFLVSRCISPDAGIPIISEGSQAIGDGEDTTESSNSGGDQPLPEPTATLIPPTNTPEPPTANPPGFVFSDGFSDGPDQAWEIQYGEVGMSNRVYTVLAPFTEEETYHLSILESGDWANVGISFTLSPLKFHDHWGVGFYYSYLGVILKHDAEGESIGVRISSEEIVIGYLSPLDEWRTISSSSVTPADLNTNLMEQSNDIRIELVNGIVTVEVNGRQMTSAQVTGPEVGKVGLWFQTNTRKEEAETYAPRIEEITVESLP